MNEGITGCLVVVVKLNSAQNIRQRAKYNFGKRHGKAGSEHSVKVEEKSRGQILEGGKSAWLL